MQYKYFLHTQPICLHFRKVSIRNNTLAACVLFLPLTLLTNFYKFSYFRHYNYEGTIFFDTCKCQYDIFVIFFFVPKVEDFEEENPIYNTQEASILQELPA